MVIIIQDSYVTKAVGDTSAVTVVKTDPVFDSSFVTGYMQAVIDSETGVTIQGYDADTTKNDVSNVFTLPQRTTITGEDNAIDFTASNNFELTATAANITVGVMATKKGQEGSITIHSASNITGWGTEFLFAPDFSAVTPTPPASPTGTMEFWYKIVEVNLVDGGTANKIHIAWAS